MLQLLRLQLRLLRRPLLLLGLRLRGRHLQRWPLCQEELRFVTESAPDPAHTASAQLVGRPACSVGLEALTAQAG